MPAKRNTNGSGRFIIKPEVKAHEKVELDIATEDWEKLKRYGQLELKGSSPQHVCVSVLSIFIEREVIPALAKHDRPQDIAVTAESKQTKPKLVKQQAEGAA